ncbi:hypothetical protein G7046_g6511 [Stylonectria norvegica]|nr:hypothetical protein G7046_g6511 [Stylonectria norvegica]
MNVAEVAVVSKGRFWTGAWVEQSNVAMEIINANPQEMCTDTHPPSGIGTGVLELDATARANSSDWGLTFLAITLGLLIHANDLLSALLLGQEPSTKIRDPGKAAPTTGHIYRSKAVKRLPSRPFAAAPKRNAHPHPSRLARLPATSNGIDKYQVADGTQPSTQQRNYDPSLSARTCECSPRRDLTRTLTPRSRSRAPWISGRELGLGALLRGCKYRLDGV